MAETADPAAAPAEAPATTGYREVQHEYSLNFAERQSLQCVRSFFENRVSTLNPSQESYSDPPTLFGRKTIVSSFATDLLPPIIDGQHYRIVVAAAIGGTDNLRWNGDRGKCLTRDEVKKTSSCLDNFFNYQSYLFCRT